ncbi:MAG: 50S ribosomal protein L7Ae [Conexivisphaerales archaeon]
MSQKPSYVKFDTPEELSQAALEAVKQAKESGKIRKGTNEVTKAIERGEAKLVVIAEDVDPPEVVAHLPMICMERKISYIYVKAKVDLGSAAGLQVGTAAVAIVDSGQGKSIVDQIVNSLSKITGA